MFRQRRQVSDEVLPSLGDSDQRARPSRERFTRRGLDRLHVGVRLRQSQQRQAVSTPHGLAP